MGNKTETVCKWMDDIFPEDVEDQNVSIFVHRRSDILGSRGKRIKFNTKFQLAIRDKKGGEDKMYKKVIHNISVPSVLRVLERYYDNCNVHIFHSKEFAKVTEDYSILDCPKSCPCNPRTKFSCGLQWSPAETRKTMEQWNKRADHECEMCDQCASLLKKPNTIGVACNDCLWGLSSYSIFNEECIQCDRKEGVSYVDRLETVSSLLMTMM